MTFAASRRLPIPADFAPPPNARLRRAWDEADRAALPSRLGHLRARLTESGVDAYFGLRREEIRYLTGVNLGEGEEKMAGNSGRFLVSGDTVVVLARDGNRAMKMGETERIPLAVRQIRSFMKANRPVA